MAGIYIHIPFCKKRCIYCDFYSTTLGHLKDEYINALEKEIEIRKNYAENETIETIYFGGGTPSQLDTADISRIITKIKSEHQVAENAEITMEANPDDLNNEYITSLKQTDINRISIGIQTFNDERLRFLNRRHTAKQAIDAVRRCISNGYDNISIDLIYGFPDESIKDWEKDIDTATGLGIQHISSYHLIYEKGTKLFDLLSDNRITELDEESSVRQFKTLISKLEDAGFVHYEISNFCKPGKESKHNTSYWQNKKYIGLGPSAHSYNQESRQWNISDIKTYINSISNGKNFFEIEKLDIYEHYNEYILTSLRTMWGADLDFIKEHFGDRLYRYFLRNSGRYVKSGDMKTDESKAVITKQGIFISDGIMSDLMWV